MKTGSILLIIALSGLGGLAVFGGRTAGATDPGDAILVALARGSWELDQLMAQSGGNAAKRRKRIIAVLTRMRDAIPPSGAEFAPHPLVDVGLQAFRQDIIRARDDVTDDTPSYFRAGSVSGACVYCHAGEI